MILCLYCFFNIFFAIYKPTQNETKQNKTKQSDDANKEESEKEKSDESEAGNVEENIPDLDSGWSCMACTFFNEGTGFMCSVCGTPNPNPMAGNQNKKNASNANKMSDKKNDENEELKIADMVDEPSKEQILFHILRSLGLKALCGMVRERSASQLLLTDPSSRQILSDLLKIGTRATDLEQYENVTFLESQEDRLLEVLHDKPFNFEERIPISAKDLSQKQMLAHSPFKNLQMTLPAQLDSESALGIKFARESPWKIMFKKEEGKRSIGYVRTRNLIPSSRAGVPAYYFEMTILKDGISRGGDTAWNAAIGLWRSGMTFYERPGAQNSYAYAGNGRVYYTASGAPIDEELQQGNYKFKQGDTVGVGWDVRNRTLFFTNNGNYINTPFDSLQVCLKLYFLCENSVFLFSFVCVCVCVCVCVVFAALKKQEK